MVFVKVCSDFDIKLISLLNYILSNDFNAILHCKNYPEIHVFTRFPPQTWYIKLCHVLRPFSWNTAVVNILWMRSDIHSFFKPQLHVCDHNRLRSNIWLRLGNFHPLSLKFLSSLIMQKSFSARCCDVTLAFYLPNQIGYSMHCGEKNQAQHILIYLWSKCVLCLQLGYILGVIFILSL